MTTNLAYKELTTTYQQINTVEDAFFMQVKLGTARVVFAAAQPDADAAYIEMKQGDVINHNIITGKGWARKESTNVKVFMSLTE